MPRMNLTEAEAALIQKEREIQRYQAFAYNQAIDDILNLTESFGWANETNKLAWQERLVGLKRAEPLK